MNDQNNKMVLNEENGGKYKEVLYKILGEYRSPSFGSMSKHDIDLLMFNALVSVGEIKENPTIYDVMKELKVTRSKARNLIYEYQLRKVEDDSQFKTQLYELLKKPLLSATSETVYLEVDNPYMIDYIRNELKNVGCVTDGSFHSELIKMSNEAFCKLYESVMEDEKKKDIENRLVALGVKPNTSLSAIMPKLMMEVAKEAAKKVAGKVGEEIFSSCLVYLKDNSDKVKEKWKDWFVN